MVQEAKSVNQDAHDTLNQKSRLDGIGKKYGGKNDSGASVNAIQLKQNGWIPCFLQSPSNAA
jgi:hypothetical protein